MDSGSSVKTSTQVPDFVVSEQELDELQKLTETIARAAVADANNKIGTPISSPLSTSQSQPSDDAESLTLLEFPEEKISPVSSSATGMSPENSTPENKVLSVSHDMNQQVD